MTYICTTLLDQGFSKRVQLVEVITGVCDFHWLKAQPSHSVLNRVVVFFLFTGRVCIIEA